MMAKGYEIIPPSIVYGGKTYADHLKGFWRWLYSVDCDNNNSGDVVYLRGVAKPENDKDGYEGGPVIRVGDDGLTITKDQAVFFCNITTNTESFGERADDQEPQLRGACISDLRQSRTPDTRQILIDEKEIELPRGFSPADFRTATDEYLLQVSDEQYGSTIARYMDVNLPPDEYRCVASGYCFLIKFNESGLHTVYSWGQGKPWKRGNYVSELLYEINVLDTDVDGTRTRAVSPLKLPFTNLIIKKLEKLKEDGEIGEKRLGELKSIINTRNKLLK